MTEIKEDPEVSVAIEAFPVDSDDIVVKTVVFGAGKTTKLFMELQPTDEGDVVLAISLDGVEADEILDSIKEFGEILQDVASSKKAEAATAEAVEKANNVG